jgi:hypothetical protein
MTICGEHPIIGGGSVKTNLIWVTDVVHITSEKSVREFLLNWDSWTQLEVSMLQTTP